jgi:hypothetical protein
MDRNSPRLMAFAARGMPLEILARKGEFDGST